MIKERIRLASRQHDFDVVIVEVGGTVGDIEGQAFSKRSVRCGAKSASANVLYIHVTLLPKIGSNGELEDQADSAVVRELGGRHSAST